MKNFNFFAVILASMLVLLGFSVTGSQAQFISGGQFSGNLACNFY